VVHTPFSAPLDTFPRRHIGPDEEESAAMLRELGLGSMAELIDRAVPGSIRLRKPLDLPEPKGERQALEELKEMRSPGGTLFSAVILAPAIMAASRRR
jgi:glycine cleavage system pyridoxal-binding protein P